MALPITVPYTFGNATTAIPLSNLDSDYATVYQAVNGIGNGSVALANVTITGGTVSNVSGVVPTPFTANGVVYASSTSALATGSALQFDGTRLFTNSTAVPAGVSGTGVSVWNKQSNTSLNAINTVASASDAFAYIGHNGSVGAIGVSYGNTAGYTPLAFYTNDSEQMRLTSTGLGIGTSSPAQKLEVYGSSPRIVLQDAGTGAPLIDISSGGGSFYIGSDNSTGSVFSTSAYARILWGIGAYPMVFATNNTERARIDSSGNLLVGYTSSNGSYKLQVNSQIFATSAIIATSDARYKTNVTPISNGLALVNMLNPVSFDWKEHSVHDFDTKNTNVGFLAQDVQEILKDEIYLNSVIRKNETELPDGTKEEFLGLSDSSLIPILVKAIQELTTRLTVLENK